MQLDENSTTKVLYKNRPVTGALSMLAIKENWNQYSTHVTCLHIQEQSQLYYGKANFVGSFSVCNVYSFRYESHFAGCFQTFPFQII